MFRLIVVTCITKPGVHPRQYHEQAYNFACLGEAMNRIAIEKTKKQFHKMELYVRCEEWAREL